MGMQARARAALPVLVLSPPATPSSHRAELRAFLMACRARLRPEDVSLPRGPRRRTAGLRREEVAALSGLSSTWYTWLEQGRTIRISEPMLAAVARALRLTGDERSYLYSLALDDPHRRREGEAGLPAALVATVDANPFPAYAKNGRWDLVHANESAKRVFGFTTTSGGGCNLMRWSFTSQARVLLRDWRSNIARDVGLFRSDLVQGKPDPIARAIVAELERDSDDFRQLWGRQTVAGRHPGTKRLSHATLGLLELAFFSAKLPDRPTLTAVFFSPADPKTARALAGKGRR
jgi:transcriptional regulator with XRE-family HTH domain